MTQGPTTMQPDASQQSVIVADGSWLMRNVLRSNLAQTFGHVHLATDGLEAVEAARATQAALVILDYQLEKLHGIEACREIRRLPGYDRTPIVLLTAYDDDRLKRDAERAGVSLVFQKPLIFEHLMEKLAPYLPLHAATAQVANEFVRGRDLLNQRRRIEAETDNAKRRYVIGMAERASPFLGLRRR